MSQIGKYFPKYGNIKRFELKNDKIKKSYPLIGQLYYKRSQLK
jgi:hypothetical protein